MKGFLESKKFAKMAANEQSYPVKTTQSDVK